MGRTFKQIREEIEARKHANMKHTGKGAMSHKMKKALGKNATEKQAKVVSDLKKKLIETMPHSFHPNMTHPIQKLIPAMAEHLAGAGLHEVEDKYQLSRNSVSSALKMWFDTRESREEALANILLDNALTSGMIFKEKAHELSARDAALATGIYTERYTGFKKAQLTNFQPDIPINLVMQLDATLAAAKKVQAKVIELPPPK